MNLTSCVSLSCIAPGVIRRTVERGSKRGSKRRHNAEMNESETGVDSGFYSRSYSLNVVESTVGDSHKSNVKVAFVCLCYNLPLKLIHETSLSHQKSWLKWLGSTVLSKLLFRVYGER